MTENEYLALMTARRRQNRLNHGLPCYRAQTANGSDEEYRQGILALAGLTGLRDR